MFPKIKTHTRLKIRTRVDSEDAQESKNAHNNKEQRHALKHKFFIMTESYEYIIGLFYTVDY